MILSDEVQADTNFAKAYNALTREDKARVMESIMITCGIESAVTIYEWMKRPDLVKSKIHQRYIAYLIFKKPIKEFFK